MANLDVSLGGLESSNPIIDIDILEINSSSPNIEQIQAWEDFEKFKFEYFIRLNLTGSLQR